MDFFENLRMSLLNFDFVITYIIHKMLVLLKNYHLNYLKDSIFQYFLKEYNRFLFFFKYIFFTIFNDRKSKDTLKAFDNFKNK